MERVGAWLAQKEELQDCYRRLLEQEEDLEVLRGCLRQPGDLADRLLASEGRSRGLAQEVQLLQRVIQVMREDLNVKAEQFSEVYLSLKSASQEREKEEQCLRARVASLERQLRAQELATMAAPRQRNLSGGPLSRFDRFGTLPVVLTSRVLACLDGVSLTRLGATSCYWRRCTRSEALWEHLYHRIFSAAALSPTTPSSLDPALLLPLTLGPGSPRRPGADRAGGASERKTEDSSQTWRSRFRTRKRIDTAWLRVGSRDAQATTLIGHRGTVTCLGVLGNRLLSGSDDGSIILWSLEPPGGSQSAVPGPPPPALGLASLFTHNGSAGANERQAPNRQSHQLADFRRHIQGALGTGEADRRAYASPPAPDRFRPTKSRVFHGHGGPVWCVAFDDGFAGDEVVPQADGANAAPEMGAGAGPADVHLDLAEAPARQAPAGEARGEDASDLFFVTGSYDRCLKIWDLGGCRRTLRGHTDWVSCLAMRRRVIVSGAYDATLRIWSATGGEMLRVLDAGAGNLLYCLAWAGAQNGGKVLAGCHRRTVQMWDVEAGQLAWQLRGHQKLVYAVENLGDRAVVSASADHTVKVWDASGSRSANLTLRGHTQPVMAVACANGRVLSGSYDESIKLWDLRRPEQPVRSFRNHAGAVFCLAADERRMFSGSVDHTIRIEAFGPAPPGGMWSPL